MHDPRTGTKQGDWWSEGQHQAKGGKGGKLDNYISIISKIYLKNHLPLIVCCVSIISLAEHKKSSTK